MVNHYGKLQGKREVNQMVKGRQKSPSRQRYEDDHPVIAIRVTRELYLQLDEARRERGMSWADLLKLGVKRELDIKKALRRAYNKGYDDGLEERKIEAESDKRFDEIIKGYEEQRKKQSG